MKKIKGKLGLYAKEREEFEAKKKQLEEEMSKTKQNMENIRKGMKWGTSNIIPSQENEEEVPIKRNKSWKINRAETANDQQPQPAPQQQQTKLSSSTSAINTVVPIPNGSRISDWCYNGALDSSPPLLKSQELYEEIRFLGRGSYGTVDLVKNSEENKLYAAKTLVLLHKNEEDSILNEVKYLRQYRHPFIINIHDVFICSSPRKLFIILHYCEGGDLGKTIANAKKNRSYLQESQILKWITQIGLALFHLHSNDVIHRDIKPVNILLSDNGEVAVLADFGLATDLSTMTEKIAITKEVGTPYYTSPEMINNEPCDMAIDCWALGVCLFELLSLALPFDGESTLALVRSILQEPPRLSQIPSNYTPELINAIEGLLIKDPKERWSIPSLLLSPIISPRLSQIASSYRPKSLEERLRRVHVRQLTLQIEKLGVSTSSLPPSLASRQVSRVTFNDSPSEPNLVALVENEEKSDSINSLANEKPHMTGILFPAVMMMNPQKKSTSSPAGISLISNPPLEERSTQEESNHHHSSSFTDSSLENNYTIPHRKTLKDFHQEVSISNIALSCAIQSDLGDSDHSNEEEGNNELETNLETNLDIMATSKVNALEQADNYLRRHQHVQQLLLESPSEQQQQQQQIVTSHISPNGGGGSGVGGGGIGPNAPSPRPPLHRISSGNFSPNYLTPEAPTSQRNLSSISPLARGRVNLTIPNSDSSSDTAMIQLEPLESTTSSSSSTSSNKFSIPSVISKSVCINPISSLSLNGSHPSPSSLPSPSSPEKSSQLSLPSLSAIVPSPSSPSPP